MENIHTDIRDARLEVLKLATSPCGNIDRSNEEITKRYNLFISLLSQPDKTVDTLHKLVQELAGNLGYHFVPKT